MVSYDNLLGVFWEQIDPTDPQGQFADKGSQYKTDIFYHDEQRRVAAEASKSALERSGKFGRPLTKPILPSTSFYPAEKYHQGYYKKNPEHYSRYKVGSGRESFIRRHKLTPLQYKVTQENATEPPFRNEFWDHKEAGIYVDVLSGQPLFSSLDKFDSGCGWPSFTKPLCPEGVVDKRGQSPGMMRPEVRSQGAGSHLGHVFVDDGRGPTGQRYCINSAALRFIPTADLDKEGYGDYRAIFGEMRE